MPKAKREVSEYEKKLMRDLFEAGYSKQEVQKISGRSAYTIYIQYCRWYSDKHEEERKRKIEEIRRKWAQEGL